MEKMWILKGRELGRILEDLCEGKLYSEYIVWKKKLFSTKTTEENIFWNNEWGVMIGTGNGGDKIEVWSILFSKLFANWETRYTKWIIGLSKYNKVNKQN